MKPTEDKNPLNVELIDHIKNSLAVYEETYDEGAWERFAVKEDRKKPVAWLWFLRGAAAIFVVGLISLLFIFQQSKEVKTPIHELTVKPKTNGGANDRLTVDSSVILKNTNAEIVAQKSLKKIENQSEALAIELESNPVKRVPQNQIVDLPIVNVPKNFEQEAINKVASEPVKDILENSAVNNNQQSVVTPIVADNEQSKLLDFLANETVKNKDNKSEKSTNKRESKFTLGLVVAPSFGNVNKLNMGYGVSVDYQLSPKFSLNSGIAYNQMSAQGSGVNDKGLLMSDVAAGPSSMALFASSNEVKSLESVKERVAGIDIPLELKYHVSKNFYANVGLSAFAVINQSQDNTYVIDRAVRVVQESSTLSGKQQLANVVISERTTEKETANKENYNYLGFYNFSLGYKQKISKANSVAIEPFVKLPMQKVNTQNLNLIGAGLKLKFEF